MARCEGEIGQVAWQEVVAALGGDKQWSGGSKDNIAVRPAANMRLAKRHPRAERYLS